MKPMVRILLVLFLLLVITPLVQARTWLDLEGEMKEILVENPDNILINFQLGVAYAKQGEIEKAYEMFNYIKKMDSDISPKEVPAIYRERLHEDPLINLSYLAFAYHIIKKYEESMQAFKELIVIEPDNIWNYNYLGLVLWDLDRFTEAEEVLLISLDLEENNYTRFILGLVYYEQGRYIRALVEFGRSRSVARTIFDMR